MGKPQLGSGSPEAQGSPAELCWWELLPSPPPRQSPLGGPTPPSPISSLQGQLFQTTGQTLMLNGLRDKQ